MFSNEVEYMRVLVVEPGGMPQNVEIKRTLEAMQAVVGGYIQAVYPFDEEIALICNEEGKLEGLPWNRPLYDVESGEIYDFVVGTFFLCAAPANESHFSGLTDEQIERCLCYLEGRDLNA